MLELLVAVILVGLFIAVCFWAINAIGLPAPFHMIAMAVVVVVALYACVRLINRISPGLFPF